VTDRNLYPEITIAELATQLTSLAEALDDPETEPEDIAQYLREIVRRLPADAPSGEGS
jgi:hypothetical protein